MTNRHQDQQSGDPANRKAPVEELFPSTTRPCPFWMKLRTSPNGRFFHVAGARFCSGPLTKSSSLSTVHVLVDTWAELEFQIVSMYYVDSRGDRWSLEPQDLRVVKRDVKSKLLIIGRVDDFWFEAQWHERRSGRFHQYVTWARSEAQAKTNAQMKAVKSDVSKMRYLASTITPIQVTHKSSKPRTEIAFTECWDQYLSPPDQDLESNEQST